jgi:hypothetical protein
MAKVESNALQLIEGIIEQIASQKIEGGGEDQDCGVYITFNNRVLYLPPQSLDDTIGVVIKVILTMKMSNENDRDQP